jgi:hypothetical protein
MLEDRKVKYDKNYKVQEVEVYVCKTDYDHHIPTDRDWET